MHRTATMALRFLVLVSVVTALALVFAPAPAPNQPYLSALSVAGLGTSALAKPCANTRCQVSAPYACVASSFAQHCVFKGTRCVKTASC